MQLTNSIETRFMNYLFDIEYKQIIRAKHIAIVGSFRQFNNEGVSLGHHF